MPLTFVRSVGVAYGQGSIRYVGLGGCDWGLAAFFGVGWAEYLIDLPSNFYKNLKLSLT